MDLLKITKIHVYILPKANHAAIFKKPLKAYENTRSAALAIATAHHTGTQLQGDTVTLNTARPSPASAQPSAI